MMCRSLFRMRQPTSGMLSLCAAATLLTCEIKMALAHAALEDLKAEIDNWSFRSCSDDVTDLDANTPAEAAMLSKLLQMHDSWRRGMSQCPALVSPSFTAKHRALLLDDLLHLQENLEKSGHTFALSACVAMAPGDDDVQDTAVRH
jgi:hypothetical protein